MKNKLCMVLLVTVLSAISASASLIMNVSEVGSDVVATVSGTVDLTGLSFYADGYADRYGAITAATSMLAIGSGFADVYSGISGSTTMGTRYDTIAASSSTGNFVEVAGNSRLLFVPDGYISGEQLDGTSTWGDTTITGLGLQTGTYIYTWGSGANADSLTVNVVPEPATAGLLGISVGALWLVRRRFFS